MDFIPLTACRACGAAELERVLDLGRQPLANSYVREPTAQPEYPLEKTEQPGASLDWRVEKMKLSKDKRRIVYNHFLTLDGIPAEAFEYRLGNRSALEWVIDQYQVSENPRSGIRSDPNRPDDEEYIVRLVGQVIRVSLQTLRIVGDLPELYAE